MLRILMMVISIPCVLSNSANFSKTSFLNSGDVLDHTPLLKAFLETFTARSTSFELHFATLHKVSPVAKCNSKDVDLAVKVSRKAFNSGVWSRTSPEFRKDVLLKFAELLRTHGIEITIIKILSI